VNNQNGYQNNAGAVGKYDPAAAKTLLDAAGWVQGSGQYRTKAGKTLELKLVIPDGVHVSSNEGLLMQHFPRGGRHQAGHQRGELKTTSSTSTSTPGQFDMTVFSWIGNDFPGLVERRRSTRTRRARTSSRTSPAPGSSAIDTMLTTAQTDLNPAQAIKGRQRRRTRRSGRRRASSRSTSAPTSSPRSPTWPTSVPSASRTPSTRTSASPAKRHAR